MVRFREGLRILSFTWKSLLAPPPVPAPEVWALGWGHGLSKEGGIRSFWFTSASLELQFESFRARAASVAGKHRGAADGRGGRAVVGGAQRFLGVLGSEVWIFLSCMCGGRQVQF